MTQSRTESREDHSEAMLDSALEALMQAGVHLRSGGRLADVGCGTGEVALAMAECEFTVTAYDASPSMVEATNERCAGLPVSARIQDPRTLVLPEGGYEVVHSSWMLHRLGQAHDTVRTMARATSPGGLVVLQWTNGGAMYDHPPHQVCGVLEDEGLEILLARDDVRIENAYGPAGAITGPAHAPGDDGDRPAHAPGDDGARFAGASADAPGTRNVRVVARRPLRSSKLARPAPRSSVRAFPLSVGTLRVVSSERLSPLMRRVVFQVVDAGPLPIEEPAETITLIWPAPGATRAVLPELKRWRFPEGTGRQHTVNLTVRRYDRASGLVTTDFFMHGDDGPASLWACGAAPGDEVGFGGTRVHWVTDPTAEWTLLIGDETAVPSMAAILEGLPAGHRAIAVAEVRDAGEHVALDAPHSEVHWIHRGERPPGEGRALEEVVRGLDLPSGRGQVWAGGESLVIQSLRRHLLRERGLRRDEVCALGYWSIPRTRRATVSPPET
ncbi:SIP domain-containing protein [Sphaerisporangium flaviroseum]|uniref:SIP domain-containing protein n=1 Tax=Sphaerisporangium flaviroseum TaxID=509199 RepID=UPI0031F1027B